MQNVLQNFQEEDSNSKTSVDQYQVPTNFHGRRSNSFTVQRFRNLSASPNLKKKLKAQGKLKQYNFITSYSNSKSSDKIRRRNSYTGLDGSFDSEKQYPDKNVFAFENEQKRRLKVQIR